MTRRRKALAAIGAAMAIGMISASPAAAADASGRTLVVTGTYAAQPVGSQRLVEYICTAHATGDVLSVAMTRCGINTNNAMALPGTSVATAGVETVSSAPFRLCFAATATFLNAMTASASGCTANLGAASMLAGTGAAIWGI